MVRVALLDQPGPLTTLFPGHHCLQNQMLDGTILNHVVQYPDGVGFVGSVDYSSLDWVHVVEMAEV